MGKEINIGDQIILISDKVNKYIQDNHYNLSGDAMRLLTGNDDNKDIYSYYFVCEFDDGTSLINETVNPLKYNAEEDDLYVGALIVPNDIFIKSETQNKPIYNIEIPVKGLYQNNYGVYSKSDYLNRSEENTNLLIKERNKIYSNKDTVSDAINNIIISNVLNDSIKEGEEIRLEYNIELINYLAPGFVSLFSYSFKNNENTLIDKDDNNLGWIFDPYKVIQKIISNTLFVVRNKEHSFEYKENGTIKTIGDLQLGFNKNKDGYTVFVICFKKTKELITKINSFR